MIKWFLIFIIASLLTGGRPIYALSYGMLWVLSALCSSGLIWVIIYLGVTAT
jgi:hypothetical protein